MVTAYRTWLYGLASSSYDPSAPAGESEFPVHIPAFGPVVAPSTVTSWARLALTREMSKRLASELVSKTVENVNGPEHVPVDCRALKLAPLDTQPAPVR